MSAAWTSFRLGLFTLLVIVSMAVVALALGIRLGPKKTVRYSTYFDESVIGLDVGAPVKFRGITIGAVEAIKVAPDRRRLEVTMKIDAKDASMLEWRKEGDSGLRAQISAPGLTGGKLIDLEYLDPAAHPPPSLPFAPPEKYVPSAPPFGLQETLTSISAALLATLHRVDGLVDQVGTEQVPERLAGALVSVDRAASDLRSTVRRVDQRHIPDRTADAIARLDTAIDSTQRILQRVDADGGLLTGTERATQSVDAFGQRATGITDELDRTLRDLGDAARTFRALSDEIERDPDMLLKGRRKGAR